MRRTYFRCPYTVGLHLPCANSCLHYPTTAILTALYNSNNNDRINDHSSEFVCGIYIAPITAMQLTKRQHYALTRATLLAKVLYLSSSNKSHETGKKRTNNWTHHSSAPQSSSSRTRLLVMIIRSIHGSLWHSYQMLRLGIVSWIARRPSIVRVMTE